MDTTIDIADQVFDRSREAPRRDGKTMRAPVDGRCRLAVQARTTEPAPEFQFPVDGLGGMTEEFQDSDWSKIRDAISPETERHNPC